MSYFILFWKNCCFLCFFREILFLRKTSHDDLWTEALFVLGKLILQTRMRSHPVGLDVWFLVGPLRLLPCLMYANSEGSGEAAQMRRLAWARPAIFYVSLLCAGSRSYMETDGNCIQWSCNYFEQCIYYNISPRNAIIEWRIEDYWTRDVFSNDTRYSPPPPHITGTGVLWNPLMPYGHFFLGILDQSSSKFRFPIIFFLLLLYFMCFLYLKQLVKVLIRRRVRLCP